MENKKKLFEIADSQQGFFTAKQAAQAGYLQPNFQRNVKSGEWIHEERGIYRLSQYPVTDRPELVLWYLWSANRKGIPQGVWSHATALDIYELSDLMPSKMHMTVPKGFKRRSVPELLILYYDNLGRDEIIEKNGYKVTSPIRTIIDMIREKATEKDIIIQSVVEAFEKGLLTRPMILSKRTIYPEIAQILEILDGKNL